VAAPFDDFTVGRTGSNPGYFVVRVLPFLDTCISKRADKIAKFIERAIREKLERDRKEP